MDESKVKKERDNRPLIITVLRKIFGYSIFLMLIYCFLTYREDINMLNFYRIMSYFDTDASVSENFTGYTFEVGIDSVHSPFNGGLVVLNKDSLKIINAAGLEDLSEQLKYSDPQLVTADNRILAYDKGGNEISIFGSYALLKQQTEENTVLWCTMNRQGDLLVLYDEPGYRGSVKLYSEDLKEKFQWSSSEYYITSGCISRSGDRISLLCIGEKILVRTYDIKQEEPIDELDITGKMLYSMEYDNRGCLSLIMDDGIYSYESDGRLRVKYPYEAGSLGCFSHENGAMPIISVNSDSASSVRLVDDGKQVERFEVPEAVSAVSYETGMLSALTNESAYIYEMEGDSLSRHKLFAAKSISKRVDGSYLVIFSDRAEVLR